MGGHMLREGLRLFRQRNLFSDRYINKNYANKKASVNKLQRLFGYIELLLILHNLQHVFHELL